MALQPTNIEAEALTLDEVKAWCYIDSEETEFDTLLDGLIVAARDVAEGWMWRGVVKATRVLVMNGFPETIEFDRSPVVEITSITYETSAGVQTLDSSAYRLSNQEEPSVLEPVSVWPETVDKSGSVVITYEAGHHGTEAFALPEPIKVGMKQLIKYWFDNRDAAVVNEGRAVDAQELPFATRVLWDFHSLRRFV